MERLAPEFTSHGRFLVSMGDFWNVETKKIDDILTNAGDLMILLKTASDFHVKNTQFTLYTRERCSLVRIRANRQGIQFSILAVIATSLS